MAPSHLRWLVTGATGKVGEHVLQQLSGRPVVGWSSSVQGSHLGTEVHRVDLDSPDRVARAFRHARPDAVLHLAGVTGISTANTDPQRTHRINVEATAQLAELCHNARARLVLASTDMVFDGTAAPYREDDPPNAVTAYGRSKAEAEGLALAVGSTVVARLSLLVAPAVSARNRSFFEAQIESLRTGRPLTLIEDEWRTPLHVLDATAALIALAESELEGVFHLGGPERLSRLELGRRIARAHGLPDSSIVVVRRADLQGDEPRPEDLSLVSDRWRRHLPRTPWRPVDEALRAEIRS